MGWGEALKLAFFLIWPVFLLILYYFWNNRKSLKNKARKQITRDDE